MTHDNTREAYQEMKASGLLSTRRLQVLETVIALCEKSGPPTAREIGEALQIMGPRACNAKSIRIWWRCPCMAPLQRFTIAKPASRAVLIN